MEEVRTQTLVLRDPSHPARPRHMAYYEWGDPLNPEIVVCVHGLSRNGRDFDVLAQALAARYRVICPDIAGRGKSSWLENKADYAYPTYLADLLALIDGLGLKAIRWIGTSMGGILGMMLAAAKPSLIRCMALNDVGAVVSAAGLKRILGYVGTQTLFATREEAMAHLKSIMQPFGIRTETQWQHLVAISFIPLPAGGYALAYDPAISQPFKDNASTGAPIEDIDLSAFWDKVTCPVLLLRGEDSDILSEATARSMCARSIPTQYVELEGCGHAPALMEDYQVRTIEEWMRNTAG